MHIESDFNFNYIVVRYWSVNGIMEIFSFLLLSSFWLFSHFNKQLSLASSCPCKKNDIQFLLFMDEPRQVYTTNKRENEKKHSTHVELKILRRKFYFTSVRMNRKFMESVRFRESEKIQKHNCYSSVWLSRSVEFSRVLLWFSNLILSSPLQLTESFKKNLTQKLVRGQGHVKLLRMNECDN